MMSQTNNPFYKLASQKEQEVEQVIEQSGSKNPFYAKSLRESDPQDAGFLQKVSDFFNISEPLSEIGSNIKNKGNTVLKGATEGIGRLGRVMGPLPQGGSTEQQLNEQTESLNELLPTEEGFVEKAARRGLREAPTMLAFPGGATAQTAKRTAAAGLLGQGAEELGLPEWAQAASELTAYIGIGPFKKLIESGKDGELIKRAKELGMTDEQLAPLLQSEGKKWLLSKLSSKGRGTQKSIRTSHEALKETYKGIQKGEAAAQEISGEAGQNFISKLHNQLIEMPSSSRDLIMKDVEELFSKPITGDTLINFYADVSKNAGKAKELSTIKPIIKEAIGSISPELKKDFNLINDLYSKYYDISSRLRPTIADQMVSAGTALSILGSIATLNLPALGTLVGVEAARRLASKMLTDPKLQQIFPKIIEALNANKFSVAKKLIDTFGINIKKEFPQVYSELKSIDLEDLRDTIQEE